MKPTVKRARGVALITVLMIVAFAALVGTALLESSNIAVHRTTALRDSEQGWWIARGVEAWVLGLLDDDRKDSQFDALNEPWAMPVDTLPVERGFVRGGVADLQGRFNLNNLDPRIAGEVYQNQFRTLLRNLPDADLPQGLDAAVRDWIDADQNPGSMNGAEDAEYLGLAPPYRAANRPFTVVSELLAIRGMTPQVFARLQPLVAALPVERAQGAQATKINVNTAPIEVLRALSQTTDENKLADFDKRRRDDPVESAAELGALIGEGIWGPEVGTGVLDYRSQYFQIQGEVFVGSSRVALYSLIHRPDNGMPVVLAHSAEPE
jgi:general secretion pathway protein K